MHSSNDLENRHGFHPGNDTTIPLHEEIRIISLHFAQNLDRILPDSREKALALTAVQEASLWANAAVAVYLAPLEKSNHS